MVSLSEFALYIPERIGSHMQTLAEFIENQLLGTSTETESNVVSNSVFSLYDFFYTYVEEN